MAVNTGRYTHSEPSLQKGHLHIRRTELRGLVYRSIPLPYGPYLFGGLPGLIMEIHDTKHNWIFTNNGFGKMPKYSSMYLYKKQYIQDLIVTTREKALTGYRNDIEDYENLSIEIFKEKVRAKRQNGYARSQ